MRATLGIKTTLEKSLRYRMKLNKPHECSCRIYYRETRFEHPRWTTVLLDELEDNQRRGGGDILGKDIDHTPSQALVTDTTDPLLGDSNMACPCSASHGTLTEQKPGLDLHIAFLPQLRNNTGFIED